MRTPETDKAVRTLPSSVNDGADTLIKVSRSLERRFIRLQQKVERAMRLCRLAEKAAISKRRKTAP